MTTGRARFAILLISAVALVSAAVLSHSAMAAAGGIDGTARKPQILAAGAGTIHGDLDFVVAATDASVVKVRFAGRTYTAEAIVTRPSSGTQYLVRTSRRFRRDECYDFTVTAVNRFGMKTWAGGAKGDGRTSEYC